MWVCVSDYSQFTRAQSGGLLLLPQNNLRTYFYKIRIDPLTLRVTGNDFTFADTFGSHNFECKQANDSRCDDLEEDYENGVQYGIAVSCHNVEDGIGLANINLQGTNFALADSTVFRGGGWRPGGETDPAGMVTPIPEANRDNYSLIFVGDYDQYVTFKGGGYCGSVSVRFQNADGTLTGMTLKYIGN